MSILWYTDYSIDSDSSASRDRRSASTSWSAWSNHQTVSLDAPTLKVQPWLHLTSSELPWHHWIGLRLLHGCEAAWRTWLCGVNCHRVICDRERFKHIQTIKAAPLEVSKKCVNKTAVWEPTLLVSLWHPVDMSLRCPGCLQITTVFSHAQTVVLCGRLAEIWSSTCLPNSNMERNWMKSMCGL